MDATGCSIEDAIAEACARGYAEADPSADLDGSDAAAKLAILCGLAFGVRVSPEHIDARSCAGIGADTFQEARRRTGTLRQVAHAAYDRERLALTAWVAPTLVAAGSFFARTLGAQNAAVIATRYAGEITITGPGAGDDATAVAVIGDLVAIARDRAAIVPAPVLIEPQIVTGLADQKLAEAV
jgi:homoserine dehydrogenase